MTHVEHTRTKETHRMAKFMLVGMSGLVVDAASFYVFSRVFHLSLLTAQACSFSVAVVNNFFWNRRWTFHDARGKSLRRQLSQFYLTSIAGLLIRSVTIALAERPFQRFVGESSFLGLPPKLISDYATLGTAVMIVFLWNYLINRHWTFGEVSAKGEKETTPNP